MQIGEQVKRQIVRQGRRLALRPRFGGIRAAAAAGVLWMLCVSPVDLRALQDLPPPPIPIDPTPLVQLLSALERAQLSDATNHKKEVEFFLKVADTHLEMARTSIKNGDHRTSERELDIYNKAMSEAMKATAANQDRRRSLAKKIEQNLYKQIKTLEAIELLFPFERQDFASAALKQAKQLRVQALNAAFASGETLKDPDEPNKPKTDSPLKDGSVRLPGPWPLQNGGLALWHSRGYRTRALRAGYVRVEQPAESAQAPSDYLTEEEDDKVREAQTADTRAKVFMKIADRRIALITGVAPPPLEKTPFWKKGEKKPEEEEREWGVLKTTKRADLLKHYARAIEECMAKIEDAYERNPKSAALSKALATLREATDRHLEALKSLGGKVTDDDEMRALADAIEQAELANKGAREGIKAK
ncbi:MAG: hypothetical protein AABO41_17450 [Acidobacteriota bacterium]